MKIVRLTAENFKRLTAVDITPNGRVVEIRGRNEQGKSSVLDAITAALGGGAVLPSKPIKNGAETARIRVDLGEIIVTRRFTPRNSTVTIEAASGARFPSPQHMLDRLVGHISFDPLEFTRMKPQDQLETLRELVPLALDVDALDALNKRDYGVRTDVNREAARLRGQASGIQFPADLPDPPVDLEMLTSVLASAGEANAELTIAHDNRQRAANSINDARTQAFDIEASLDEQLAKLAAGYMVTAARYDSQIAEVEQRLATLRQERQDYIRDTDAIVEQRRSDALARIADIRAKADKAQADEDALEPLSDPIDTSQLMLAIGKAREVDDWIAAKLRRETIEAEAAALEKRSEALTEAMESRTAAKVKAITEAKMPVPGLAFGEGEVLFRGVPFDQASGAEKIRVSVAIAMAANPELRVLCVRDGSLLDGESMAALAAAVTEKDYQLWIEVTDDSGAVGIVIEDGTVAGAAPRETAAKAQASLI